MRAVTVVIALLVLCLTLVWILPTPIAARGIAGYLPLHMLLETVSIVISSMVFVVGWNDYGDRVSAKFVPLACLFFGVAWLDFSHTLSFFGMPDFVTPNGPDKPIYFWLTARSLAAIGLLASAVLRWRPLTSAATRYVMLITVLGAVGLLHWVVLFQVDSTKGLFLIPGKGLTPLKQGIEYAIIATNIAALLALGLRMRKKLPFNAALLFGAVCAMALSEFCFTLYGEVTDIYNLLGHIYKVVADLFVYRAFVATTIEQPYRQLKELQSQQQATLNAIPDLMFEVGLDGWVYDYRLPKADQPAVALGEFLEKHLSDILPKDASLTCMAAIQDASNNGRSVGAVYSLHLPQGERWFELSVSKFEKGNRKDPCFILLARDITARQQGEEDTRIAATAFESQQGMIITNAQQVILRVNQAFTEITGYTAQETLGQTLRLPRSSRHDAAFYAAIWNSISGSGSWHGEIWNRRKNGEIYPQLLTVSAVKDAAGRVTHYVGAFSDITERKTAQVQIQSLAFSDPLTGLPNRRLLMDRLQQAQATSAGRQRNGALLLVDLDDFKTLNDTRGHYEGDLLLQQVAQRLTACIREGGTVARVGGDEFVVLLEDLSQNLQEAATEAKTVAEEVLAILCQNYQLASYEHHGSASIGIALLGKPQEAITEPLKRAELAMYQAKAAGRNTLRFFDPQMQAIVTSRAVLAVALREALESNQFVLHYQAQISGQRRITGVEALVRWQDPKRGRVSPADFIPLAEETGLILPLGQWVLETACAQLVLWAARPDMAHLTIAVNVSARQFHQSDFVDQVLATLERTGANPHRLKLELTESLLVTNIEGVIAKISALKGKGVAFSLDDFGTGYSSLSYLKRLPLDQLKIDQSFVRDILLDANDAAIAKMVVVLAQSMGLEVIAEGVETQAQCDFLADLGCYHYQGYLFSRPLPLPEFEAFVARG